MPPDVQIAIAVGNVPGANAFINHLMTRKKFTFQRADLDTYLAGVLKVKDVTRHAQRIMKLLREQGLLEVAEEGRGAIGADYVFNAERWTEIANSKHAFDLGKRRRQPSA